MKSLDLANNLRLGPDPDASFRVLADLGLSEPDIARYFAMNRDAVARFRQMGSAASDVGLREAAAMAGIPISRRHT